jgi:acetyl-CoA acetyltransferase
MSPAPVARKAAIVGIGETAWFKHGASPDPEFKMCLDAILAAADDAGIKATEIDGFASYANDRNDSVRLQTALGIPDLTYSNMMWGGGGGGGSGALANAAAAVAAGYAKYVVVYRSLAQGQFGRFGQRANTAAPFPDSYMQPYGVLSAAQRFAFRVQRFMWEYSVTQDALAAIAMASYHHAQRNPKAVMYGRPLSRESYDNSRWIVEPFHLFDCCQENDAAAAVIVTSAERARDLRHKPAYILAASQGSDFRQGAAAHNAPDLATSNFKTVAARLYEMAGVEAKDIDVAQVYENFTGGVMMAIVEHGFCAPEEVNEFMTFENLTWPNGRLPINTSGGNLAECYAHGLELVTEAVRQIRRTSHCQVKDVDLSMVVSGPMVQPVSSSILCA